MARQRRDASEEERWRTGSQNAKTAGTAIERLFAASLAQTDTTMSDVGSVPVLSVYCLARFMRRESGDPAHVVVRSAGPD